LTISGNTVAWNLNTHQCAQLVLNANVALSNPTNQLAGSTYTIVVNQDGTGNKTMTFGNAYIWQGNAAPVLTSAANSIDLLVFYSTGTKMLGSYTRNFK
jgi:hypothetical protein